MVASMMLGAIVSEIGRKGIDGLRDSHVLLYSEVIGRRPVCPTADHCHLTWSERELVRH